MSSAALAPRFDALDPNVVADPYPEYARLREAGPVCRLGPGSWGVTRWTDVTSLQHDPRLGSEFPAGYHDISVGSGPASAFFQRIMLYRDPPDHVRLRRLMGRAFSPAVVRQLRSYVSELVDELLEPALRTGRMDVAQELAYPLPVRVVCRLMGIPPESTDDVRRHATNLGRAFTAVVPEHARADADIAVRWLREHIGALLDERRSRRGDDLLSRLLDAEESGETLTHDEIVDNTVFSFFAGFETTVHMITTGVAALLRHPGELARLRADRSLAGTAVDEFLRWDAPIQGTARYVREPLEIAGRPIRRGRVVVLMLGSANHDEQRFDRPDRLDVGRTDNPHVTFGGGAHLCLGAFLARMEGAVVFDRLARLAVLEPGGPAVRENDTPFRAYASVPVLIG